ncbi:MAG: anti-sigma factor domain-containing protein [Clostridia bacterium]|nr:anti-sigma factor domain-containing protein [Clostridia bacterium]
MIKIGTIMEIEKSRVLVMTIDFNMVFVRRKAEMFVGQQISFTEKDILNRSKNIPRYLAFAASIAAVIAIAFIWYFSMPFKGLSNQIYAYIDVDINPSLELSVNEKNMIIDIYPLNSDAEKLVQKIEIKGMAVNKGIELIVQKSREMGYLLPKDPKSVLLITGTLNSKGNKVNGNQKNEDKKLDELLETFYSTNGTNKDLLIKVVKVDPAVKEQADANGISTGRQILLIKAREKGVDISLDDVKNNKVSTLLDRLLGEIDGEPQTDSLNPDTGTSAPSGKAALPVQKQAPVKNAGEGSKNVQSKEQDIPKSSGNETKTAGKVSGNSTVQTKPESNTSAKIKIRYFNAKKTVGDVMQINPEFQVVNNSDEIIDLKDVKFRYYFTIDGEEDQTFSCWATIGKEKVEGKFVKMESSKDKADYYLEVSFTGGTCAPGSSVEIYSWFNKAKWTIYKQDNDYSYNPEFEDGHFTDWNKVTAYYKGKLVWGIEP